jgi:hypothetical protein
MPEEIALVQEQKEIRDTQWMLEYWPWITPQIEKVT